MSPEADPVTKRVWKHINKIGRSTALEVALDLDLDPMEVERILDDLVAGHLLHLDAPVPVRNPSRMTKRTGRAASAEPPEGPDEPSL